MVKDSSIYVETKVKQEGVLCFALLLYIGRLLMRNQLERVLIANSFQIEEKLLG